MPKISVIIPCYNQGQYLSEALNSVLVQTYTDWECIIVNDGSSDNTEDLALAYCKKDNRFKYIRKENGGTSSAKNVGIQAAQGKWIQFLDSDDYIAPEKLGLSLKVISADKSLSIVVCDFRLFTENISDATKSYFDIKQEYLSLESILLKWNSEFTIPIHSGLFEANLMKSVMFNQDLSGAEDWVMWITLFMKGAKASYLDYPLAFYRNHQSSATKNISLMNENLVKAYKYILAFIPSEYKQKLMFTIIDSLAYKILLTENKVLVAEENIAYFQQSKDYQIGNFILSPIRKIKYLLFGKN